MNEANATWGLQLPFPTILGSKKYEQFDASKADCNFGFIKVKNQRLDPDRWKVVRDKPRGMTKVVKHKSRKGQNSWLWLLNLIGSAPSLFGLIWIDSGICDWTYGISPKVNFRYPVYATSTCHVGRCHWLGSTPITLNFSHRAYRICPTPSPRMGARPSSGCKGTRGAV